MLGSPAKALAYKDETGLSIEMPWAVELSRLIFVTGMPSFAMLDIDESPLRSSPSLIDYNTID